jgi:hypothetical protein
MYLPISAKIQNKLSKLSKNASFDKREDFHPQCGEVWKEGCEDEGECDAFEVSTSLLLSQHARYQKGVYG